MTRVFEEDESRDIFLSPSKKISLVDGINALSQSAKSAVEVQLGEAIYAVEKGIPTQSTVWGGSPNLQQFEFFARKQILSVDGVDEVTEFDAEIIGDTLSYQASISTIYGEAVIDGSV